MSDPRDEFAQSLDAPDHRVDLCRSALWVAAEEYPSLDVESYLTRLDEMALDVGSRLGGGDPSAHAVADRVAALNRYLFDEQGFSGNRADYYDPRNSYLNDVLDRRTGIPITLSLVFVGVAERIGLQAAGIGFPGHFLARVEADEPLIVDPFIGETLTTDAVAERLLAISPDEVLRPELHLRPARPREVVVRLLSNLKRVFLERRDIERTVACIERILIAMPDAPHEVRDRGLLYDQMGYDAAAAADLERFLELAPDDPSSAPVAKRLAAVRARMRVH